MAGLCLVRTAMLASLLVLLAGDISTNLGPQVSGFHTQKGLNLCHWNVEHLTNSKLEEIRIYYLIVS